MTTAQVRDALARATAEAFRLGQRQAKAKGAEHVAQASAQSYAAQLVLPMVDLAIEQAVEAAVLLHCQATLDPEPAGDPPLDTAATA